MAGILLDNPEPQFRKGMVIVRRTDTLGAKLEIHNHAEFSAFIKKIIQKIWPFTTCFTKEFKSFPKKLEMFPVTQVMESQPRAQKTCIRQRVFGDK